MAALQELALLYGVEPSHENTSRKRVAASDETLRRILQSLGAPIDSCASIDDALRAKKREIASRLIEPVTVVWAGELLRVTVRVPRHLVDTPIQSQLLLEDGSEASPGMHADTSPQRKSSNGRSGYVAKHLQGPMLPSGYHRLTLEIGELRGESLVIVAPRQAYAGDESGGSWGLFASAYGLRSENSWGIGDFSDLKRLGQFTQAQGGNYVATLPLLATFVDEPGEVSPYSPASRLFWNECFLDITVIPELRDCETARYWLESEAVRREIAELRSLAIVDYRRVMALKRQGLKALARHFFQGGSSRRDAFYAYAEKHPRVSDYALFRAVGDRQQTSWTQWPERLRAGHCRTGDGDVATRNYYLYAQWLCEEQISSMSRAAGSAQGLYLDLPLGVSGMGYDVWRMRHLFATEASGGCPPDAVFTEGQNWGFPPLHPQHVRDEGYAYVIEAVRRQMQYAAALRIDHMPVLHRLYWVPSGMSACEGAYVRYASEELYAIFNLESHRHHTLLVGEDLGTVAPEIRRSMNDHRIHGMYAVQYAIEPKPAALPEIPALSAASINTHDMPPLASFVAGQDIDERLALGILNAESAAQARREREVLLTALEGYLHDQGPNTESMPLEQWLYRLLLLLAQSDARLLTLNLEDLWLETAAQNIPSTTISDNWRRKLRVSLEELALAPRINELLREISRVRAPVKCSTSAPLARAFE